MIFAATALAGAAAAVWVASLTRLDSAGALCLEEASLEMEAEAGAEAEPGM